MPAESEDFAQMVEQHAKRLARGAAGFAADMKAQGIHVGMGSPARCVNCGEPWPCRSQGPWCCEYTGDEWTGDISNHHGIPEGEGYCPGPHVQAMQSGSSGGEG